MLCLLAPLTAPGTLEGIKNFRPVSPSLPGIYRSAGLESATPADVAQFLDGAKIRTIIDLRNDDEIDKARRDGTDYGLALVDAFNRRAPVGPGQLASEGSGNLRRVRVPLLCDVDAFFDGVAAQLSPAKKAEAMAYKAFNARRYDQLLYDEVSRGRQTLLYTTMLKTSTGWGEALRLAADRSSGNVLFHCAQGKDRTGVLAALLQHAAGDEPQAILAEYAASEALLMQTPEDLAAEDAKKRAAAASGSKGTAAEENGGVDWSALRGSPPEAMAETLDWIRAEYGAIDYFLASVGCDEDWRQVLLRSYR